MQRRIEALRKEYADDNEALTAPDQIAQESAMHSLYSDYYVYESFIARRPEEEC